MGARIAAASPIHNGLGTRIQIHRFLGPALDAAGYEPVRADDAASGLREIARKPPDAVVLDLGLPDMDGKQALEKARAFYDGPIIILSARDRETEKIDALDLGADDYLEKPFGVGQLRQKVEADPATPTLIQTEPGVGYRWLS